MINSTNYENIIINVRTKVIDILRICPDRVFNSLSVHGADLFKAINETTFTSFSLNDCFIIFRLEEDADKYYILTERDNSKSSIFTFKFVLHIYGNPCHEASQRLLMGFKNETILQSLYDSGIHILGLTPPKFTYEPINNVIWPRCDIDIRLEVRFNCGDQLDEGTFTVINKKGIKIETIDEVEKRINNKIEN